jgi:hypothetical protein
MEESHMLNIIDPTRRTASTLCRLLPAIVAMALQSGNAAATPADPVSTTQTRVRAEDFPIFPWDQLGSNQARYDEARDCGFNVGGFVAPENLDLAQKAGLKAFVVDPAIKIRENLSLSDADITSNVRSAIARVGSHPAVLGYHLIDEPAGKLLPTVANWVNAFNAEAPDTIAFVNLFPWFQTGYEDYLTTFIQLSKPKVFSYDNYVILDDGSIRPTFYLNLEIARDLSLKTGIPFWFVGLANAHFSYAEPTYATFRFQMYSALAYGVRGMGWFTYTARDRGNYRLTAIDFDGRKTPTWDMLRAANMQIHCLGPVYTTLKSVNVFHYPDVPRGCRGIESSRYLNEVKGKGPFVVGEFEHPDGRPYFLIVNRSLTKSTSYEVRLKTPGKLMKVSSFTGAIGPWSAENNWLAPGQGMLLFVDPQGEK